MHNVNTVALVIFGLFLLGVIAWAVTEHVLGVKRLKALAEEHSRRHQYDATQRSRRQIAKAAADELAQIESAVRAARLVN